MKNKLIKYLFFTFIVSWLMMMVACYFSYINKSVYEILKIVILFVPMLGAIISGLKFEEMELKPKFKKNLKFYILAWLLPQGLTILGLIIYYLLVKGSFDINASYLASIIGKENIDALNNNGIDTWLYALIEFTSCLFYGTLINAFEVIGEEIGWHKVLYPALKEKYSLNIARIIGGVICGIWYMPLIVLLGHQYGFNYFGYPFIGILVFIIYKIFLGTLLDYIDINTSSIWVEAVAAGSIEATTYALVFLNVSFADKMILGPLPTGIISMIPLIIVVLLIVRNEKKEIEKK